MLDAIKGFAFANLVIFVVILIILPPVGVVLFGLLFVPIIILSGFAWLAGLVSTIFRKERA